MSELTALQKQIMELLKNKNKNLTFKQIKRYLHIDGEEDLTILKSSLYDLEVSGYLYLNDYDEYMLFDKLPELAIGEVRCNSKGKAYVVVGRNNIFIADSYLNGAIVGDIVIVRRNNYKALGNSRGSIDKILKRNHGEIIFDYVNGELIPYNWPTAINVTIPDAEMAKLIDGERIVIKIGLDKIDDAYLGHIVDFIGHKDDPTFDIATIARSNGMEIEFSEAALQQASKISDYVTNLDIEKRLSNGGVDFRSANVFTLDGKTCKDMDDAFQITKKANGNFVFIGHISDVDYWIPANTTLDLEARRRGTSGYPYKFSIPMFPRNITNGICSLNPDVDRLTFSYLVELTPDGEVVNFERFDGIIKSKMKMSYEDVNDIFERHIPHPEYEPYLYDLALFLEWGEVLERRRQKRGYVKFGSSEVYFKDIDGIPIDIEPKKRGVAERAIENSMILLGECAGEYFHWFNMPGVFRVHPTPEAKAIRQTLSLIHLNMSTPKVIKNPKVFQELLDKVCRYDPANVYSDLLLQTMRRAYYNPDDNIGHFGLALPWYMQVTSPIRRYGDKYNQYIDRAMREDITKIDTDALYEELKGICQNISAKERIADKTERDVSHYKMAEYMESHIGEHFNCFVAYISKSGLAVKTDNYISGKIEMSVLREQGYVYDSEHIRLVNIKNQTKINIGDALDAKLVKADKETGKIEFTLRGIKEKQKVYRAS